MTLDSVVNPQVLNKYLISVDVKSGRFKFQSGRAGGETKKRKSPAKSGRVGIYESQIVSGLYAALCFTSNRPNRRWTMFI